MGSTGIQIEMQPLIMVILLSAPLTCNFSFLAATSHLLAPHPSCICSQPSASRSPQTSPFSWPSHLTLISHRQRSKCIHYDNVNNLHLSPLSPQPLSLNAYLSTLISTLISHPGLISHPSSLNFISQPSSLNPHHSSLISHFPSLDPHLSPSTSQPSSLNNHLYTIVSKL